MIVNNEQEPRHGLVSGITQHLSDATMVDHKKFQPRFELSTFQKLVKIITV
jgi:hypothetical protein